MVRIHKANIIGRFFYIKSNKLFSYYNRKILIFNGTILIAKNERNECQSENKVKFEETIDN